MAAKIIQVSDDNGSNWYTLPGSTGEFSNEAEQTEDTIFGQSFRSNESGLINWSVSANSVYKGYSGYAAKIKQVGSATSATGEAMTLVSGKVYRINTASKEIWDRSATVTVYDGTSDETANVEWVDFLFGQIKFLDAYTPTGAITVDVDYFPTTAVCYTKSFTLTQTADAIDDTDFCAAQANGGYRTFDPGLRTVSLDLSGFYNAASGFSTLLTNRTEVIIEINPDGSGLSTARGFFKATSRSQSGDVGALEEESVTFTLTVPDEQNPDLYVPFNWDHDGSSTISNAIKICLTSWLDQTVIDVQYLHDGTNGWKGDCVVTDVSLEGSIDGINTFTANFQGSGALTAVP